MSRRWLVSVVMISALTAQAEPRPVSSSERAWSAVLIGAARTATHGVIIGFLVLDTLAIELANLGR